MSALKTETVRAFDYLELERLVKKLYGMDINILSEDFITYERIGHCTYHEWEVDGESELGTVGDKEIVQKWIATGQYKSIDMSDVPEYDWSDTADVALEHILHRLYIEDHIPAGKYLMKVDW